MLFIDKATSAYHTMVYNRKSATEMIKFIEANETAQALFFMMSQEYPALLLILMIYM